MGARPRMTGTTLPAHSPPVIERQVVAAGVRLRVREAGRGNPVLLLHGFGDSSATWSAVLPRLARHHRVIAPDLPGFGASGPLPEGDMLDVLVGAVIDLHRTLEVEAPVAVVGNSMGGAVALRLALDRPDLVSRLVLVDAAGLAVGVPIWWRLLTAQVAPLGALAVATAGRIPTGLVQRAAGRIYARLTFHDGGACSGEVRDGFAAHYRGAEDIRRLTVQGARLVRCLGDGRLLRESVRLRQPLLVVWGRHDRLVPVGDGERIARTVPGCRLHVVEDCGHCPQLERPDRFLAAVEPFLRARPTARPGRVRGEDAQARSA